MKCRGRWDTDIVESVLSQGVAPLTVYAMAADALQLRRDWPIRREFKPLYSGYAREYTLHSYLADSMDKLRIEVEQEYEGKPVRKLLFNALYFIARRSCNIFERTGRQEILFTLYKNLITLEGRDPLGKKFENEERVCLGIIRQAENDRNVKDFLHFLKNRGYLKGLGTINEYLYQGSV